MGHGHPLPRMPPAHRPPTVPAMVAPGKEAKMHVANLAVALQPPPGGPLLRVRGRGKEAEGGLVGAFDVDVRPGSGRGGGRVGVVHNHHLVPWPSVVVVDCFGWG